MSVLVIAPHPDDEVLGVGGTMARFADEGRDVTVAIVTKGEPPLYETESVATVRQEARDAHQVLGVKETVFLDFPSAQLDRVPHTELNAAMVRILEEIRPEIVFLPFRGDIHLDHRLVFDSAMVALRPSSMTRPSTLFAYETLSETNWNAQGAGITAPFVPDSFIRIEDFLDLKLKAMEVYASQLRSFPDERSIEAVQALARHRGAMVGFTAAEGFATIRNVI